LLGLCTALIRSTHPPPSSEKSHGGEQQERQSQPVEQLTIKNAQKRKGAKNSLNP
jgi:hypothetical protein